MAWDYFRDGQRLTDASLKVVSMLKPTQLTSTTTYEVRFFCCGTVAELTHQQIRRRQEKGRHARRNGQPVPVCEQCKYQQRARNQRASLAPSAALGHWPVPAAVLSSRNGDRR
jgi:hypothetical protein